jgi:hypothetical protein
MRIALAAFDGVLTFAWAHYAYEPWSFLDSPEPKGIPLWMFGVAGISAMLLGGSTEVSMFFLFIPLFAVIIGIPPTFTWFLPMRRTTG